VAQVRPFDEVHTRIVPEAFVDLAVANVESCDRCGAVLQEAVGETAGGRPYIQGAEAGHLEGEGLQRGLELEPATADIAIGHGEFEEGVGADGPARLVGDLAVDPDLAGEDGPLGLLAAFTKATLDKLLVKAQAHARV